MPSYSGEQKHLFMLYQNKSFNLIMMLTLGANLYVTSNIWCFILSQKQTWTEVEQHADSGDGAAEAGVCLLMLFSVSI